VLDGEEAAHLSQVLRAKPGDIFWAIDGSGRKYRAVIESIDKKTISGIIAATTRLENEPFYQITLAQGLCRQGKMDDIVEKGTELGVASFVFFYSEKGYMNSDDAPHKRLKRLDRVARAAAKQSKRSLIPSVSDPMPFSQMLRLRNQYDLSLAAVFHPDSRPVETYLEDMSAIKRILLAVGPESGCSDVETAACIEYGFLPVSLGPRRLRTETAGIVFPSLVLSRLGDL
jgi:16S rRNA (uracil1498-N3)-methyltransferase